MKSENKDISAAITNETVNPIVALEKQFSTLALEEKKSLREQFTIFLLSLTDETKITNSPKNELAQQNVLESIFEIVRDEYEVSKKIPDKKQRDVQRQRMLQLAQNISKYFEYLINSSKNSVQYFEKNDDSKKIWEGFFEEINQLPVDDAALPKQQEFSPWFHLAYHLNSPLIYKTWVKFGGQAYLELPSLINNNWPLYLITSAPLQSSGDIYHVAAFLLIMRAYGSLLPKVVLTYDTVPSTAAVPTNVNYVQTYHHAVQRSGAFLRGLGLGAWVSEHNISSHNSGAYYNGRRQEAIDSFLAKEYPNRYYIDQRTTTTLLVSFAKKVGREQSTTIIRRQLRGYCDSDYFKGQELTQIQQYGSTSKQSIMNKYPGAQPFLVIHRREAGGQKGANANQTFPSSPQEAFLATVIKFLTAKGIGTIIINANSRQAPDGYLDTLTFSPFSLKQTSYISREVEQGVQTERDLSKFYHLELLLQIYTLTNCLGVVGNTSGTLDLVSFMGFRVFNLHVFDQLPAIDYQDYRLMMQMIFLTIQVSKEWSEYPTRGKPNVLIQHLEQWLPPTKSSHSLSDQFRAPDIRNLTLFSTIKSTNPTTPPVAVPAWEDVSSSVIKEVGFKP